MSDDIVFIALPDGTEISADNIPSGVVSLVTYSVPVTEKEAWTWITSCFADTGTPIHTFDIYFLDMNGNEVDASGVVITIDCPHCFGKPMVYSLNTNGEIELLTQNARSISVTFTTNGSRYYVLAEKKANSDENNTENKENPMDKSNLAEDEDKNQTDGNTVIDENSDTVDKDDSFSYEQLDSNKRDTVEEDGSMDIQQNDTGSHWWLWVSIPVAAGTVGSFLLLWKKRK